MFSRSFTRTLYVLISVFALTLVVVTANNMRNAASTFLESRRTTELAQTDKILFHALSLRGQRPQVREILNQDSDVSSKIAEMRSAAETGATAAIGAVEVAALPNSATESAELRKLWDATAASYKDVEAEARKPAAQRDAGVYKRWFADMGGLSDKLSVASAALANAVRMTDPSIAEMVQVRQLAWQIRDSYGFQCGQLTAAVQKGGPLDPAAHDAQRGWLGAVDGAWSNLDQILARPGVPASITSAVSAARTAQATAQKSMDDILAQNAASGQAVPAAARWTEICLSAVKPLLQVGTEAIDQIESYAAERRAAAMSSLLVNAAGFIFTVLLSGGAVLLIRRRFARPVQDILHAIDRLAARDYDAPIPQRHHPDEFGAVVDALGTLRETAKRVDRLTAEQEEARKREERANAFARAVKEFQEKMAKIVSSVAAAAAQLQSNARSMTASADSSSGRASAAASAALQASNNVQTVASATEELNASIAEVNRQIGDSAKVAADGVRKIEETTVIVKELNTVTAGIDTATKLIDDIAGQVNLLALNATIEAARAGEAGRGFAVVAGEVKNLAVRAGNAAKEIGKLVEQVQGETRRATSAIDLVSESIRRTSDISTAIAAAAEEQTSATGEIARNVQEASKGNEDVSRNVEAVAQAAVETGSTAAQVLEAAQQMSSEAEVLRDVVRQFVNEIQAA